jgi:hypothetical protein
VSFALGKWAASTAAAYSILSLPFAV